MWRRSSPGAYSRSVWNATSLVDRSLVVWPSRSRIQPAVIGGSTRVRGWTYSRTCRPEDTSLRAMPSGSPFTLSAGPIGMIERRCVGTTNGSSNRPPGASVPTSTVATPAPTGTSTRAPSDGRARSFTARTRPTASCPPATTRCGSTDRSIVRARRPTVIASETARTTRQAPARISSSSQSRRAPTTQAATPMAATVHPSEVTGATAARARSRTTVRRPAGWAAEPGPPPAPPPVRS